MGALAAALSLNAWTVAAAMAALLGGCASADLSKSGKIQDQVVEGLPVGTPQPSFVARAIWYPKADGAGTTDTSNVGGITGVVALAGDSLWFLEWNQVLRGYDTLRSLEIIPAIRVSVVHSGLIDMLVVESKDMSFDSFELMRQGQFAPDPQTTRELCDLIRDYRAKHPPPDE